MLVAKKAEAAKAKPAPAPAPAAKPPPPKPKPPAPAAPASAAAAAGGAPAPASGASAAGGGGDGSSSSAAPAAGGGKGSALAAAAGAKSSSHIAEQVGVPYNGGVCAAFEWEQTLGDVTIHAPVPEGTRPRDIVCTIGRAHLLLTLRGAAAPIIDADFPCDARNGQEVWEKVKTVDSYWNLADLRGKPCVCVYLEKEREAWWKSAVHGASEIDTTKVGADPSPHPHPRR